MQSQTESPGLRLRAGGGGISIVKAQGGQSMRSHLQREPWDLLPPSSRKQGAWHNAGRLLMSQQRKIHGLLIATLGQRCARKIFTSLDLAFCISGVGISRFAESIGYSLLVASRKADHLPYFSFEEAKHRRLHDIPQVSAK